jgi:lipopolysaccharide/colanic/teichoic acid biosynthesis glycosyltransferase
LDKAIRRNFAEGARTGASAPALRLVREWFYRLGALVGLVLLAPVLAAAALAVLLDDGWPILYRQTRVGRRNRPFQLLKFRSMRNVSGGPVITAAADPRVTRTGRILRKFKLDELPQLWNVVRGDMSLVGSRPEVPRYVDYGDGRWRQVLEDLPGLTDLATLVYRNEEELLAAAADPEAYYREVVLPDKLQLNLRYQRGRTLFSDLRLIFITVKYSLAPGGFDALAIRRSLVVDSEEE